MLLSFTLKRRGRRAEFFACIRKKRTQADTCKNPMTLVTCGGPGSRNWAMRAEETFNGTVFYVIKKICLTT